MALALWYLRYSSQKASKPDAAGIFSAINGKIAAARSSTAVDSEAARNFLLTSILSPALVMRIPCGGPPGSITLQTLSPFSLFGRGRVSSTEVWSRKAPFPLVSKSFFAFATASGRTLSRS